jgi:hypothetical protein
LKRLLHAHFGGAHNSIKQAMTGDRGIKSGANRFAVADAFGQSRV